MRESTDAIQTVLFLGMVGVTLLALVYPWSLRTHASRIWVHLPLSLVPLYLAYEGTMSPEMNIRIDLFLLWPLLGLAGVCYALKLLLWVGLRQKSPDPNAMPLPQTAGERPANSPGDMDTANQKLAHLLPKPNDANKT
jgi:hypothetical protein